MTDIPEVVTNSKTIDRRQFMKVGSLFVPFALLTTSCVDLDGSAGNYMNPELILENDWAGVFENYYAEKGLIFETKDIATYKKLIDISIAENTGFTFDPNIIQNYFSFFENMDKSTRRYQVIKEGEEIGITPDFANVSEGKVIIVNMSDGIPEKANELFASNVLVQNNPNKDMRDVAGFTIIQGGKFVIVLRIPDQYSEGPGQSFDHRVTSSIMTMLNESGNASIKVDLDKSFLPITDLLQKDQEELVKDVFCGSFADAGQYKYQGNSYQEYVTEMSTAQCSTIGVGDGRVYTLNKIILSEQEYFQLPAQSFLLERQ